MVRKEEELVYCSCFAAFDSISVLLRLAVSSRVFFFLGVDLLQLNNKELFILGWFTIHP